MAVILGLLSPSSALAVEPSRTSTTGWRLAPPREAAASAGGTYAGDPAPPAAVSFLLPAGVALHFNTFVHAEAVLWDESSADAVDPSDGRPLNDTRFLIRRARLRATLEHGFASSSVELDGNTLDGPTAQLLGADVTLRWPVASGPPPAAATLGLVKVPFGIAAPERAHRRLFFEVPTYVRAFFPGEYDLGLVLHGTWRFLDYRLAAMNGSPVGEALFGGRDLTSSKDLLGRLGLRLTPTSGVRVQLGASTLYGRGLDPGTPTTKDELTWVDENENGLVELTELRVVAGTSALAPRGFDRFAVGGDARVAVDVPLLGELVVLGELAWGANLDRGLFVSLPTRAGRDLRQVAWWVGLVAELGPWARVGLRYDRYDPDADASDERGGLRVPFDATVSTLGAVAEWRPLELVMVALEYDHRDNALGRGADGAPGRFPDDSLTVRAAVGL